MLILTDTGILLRLFAVADPLHATVTNATTVLKARGEVLVTAFQNHSEFWNACTRPATARGGFGLSTAETAKRLSVVEATIPLLADHAAAHAIWKGLVVAHAVKGKQVHDAKLVALMKAQGVTHILTLNGGDFTRYSGITVIDPSSLVTSSAAPP